MTSDISLLTVLRAAMVAKTAILGISPSSAIIHKILETNSGFQVK